MRKYLLAGCLILLLLFQAGCGEEIPVIAGDASFQAEGVSIVNEGNYYNVKIDFTCGLTHKQLGEAYAKGILKVVPNYESLVDSYIGENLTSYENKYAMYRVEDIKPQVNKEYAEEIEGMASVFSGGSQNKFKDNKISKDEFFLFNLFTDAVRGTQCSYISVYGDRSDDHRNMVARNLDWYGGSVNQLPKIQAFITYKYTDKKVYSIGYLGYMGILTGFNDHKVFAGILDSGTNAPYSSEGRRSYPLDLRFALENTKNMKEAAEFMQDPTKLYSFNHNIGFSDPDTSIILENNFSGNGTNGHKVKRAIRTEDSKLNNSVSWEIKDSIASVNSFILYGNHDNHSSNKYNTKRWNNIKKQLQNKGATVSFEELKEVACYADGSPGTFSESGDVYNKMTLQMVIFQPDTLKLEVFFRPKNIRKNPGNPVFEKITVS